MNTSEDFPLPSRLWVRLRKNKPWVWVFAGIGVAVPIALISWLVTDSSRHAPSNAVGGDITSSASGNSASVTAINSNVSVRNNDPTVAKAIAEAIAKATEVLGQELKEKNRKLAEKERVLADVR